jgi:putative cell wall-binding protein
MRSKTVQLFASLAVVALFAALPATPAGAAGPTVTRVAGVDRFDTAAQVSASVFGVGAPVAFIATGDNFPDALAAAAASAHQDGPVLLVHTHSLPQPTITELTRLKPGKIVVLGGTAAIDTTVEQQLAQYTTGAVVRIQGADRYATAAALSAAAFTSPVGTMFIATGQNFPDALSAGPAGGVEGSPVLLVPGQGSVPAPVVTELQRLKPANIIVLGGPDVISDAVVNAIVPFASSQVSRGFGQDRFSTSVLVSTNEFSAAPSVLLATGRNYPDALVAGGPGGLAKSPVLLVDSTCIPPQVNAEIVRLGATRIIVLGGTAAVSDAVLNRQICTGSQPGHFSFNDGPVLVGASGVPAGTYRTRVRSNGCFWGRFSGPDTQNDLVGAGSTNEPEITTIQPGDYEFSSANCATWTNDLSAITSSPTAPLPAGNYFVGTDVAPGTWTAVGSSQCYWARESGFGGASSDIIADNSGPSDPTNNPVVTIAPTDQGFFSDGCGTWTKTG